MLRENVSSSNIRSIGYDKEKKDLEVEFSNGTIYQYHDVPPALHEDFMKSESKGKFFYGFIRKSSFKYTKLEEKKDVTEKDTTSSAKA